MGILPRELVADELSRRIASGRLASGQKLPAELTIAEEFRVSRGTVRCAIRTLAERGLVQQRHGAGAFVTGEPEETRRIAFLFPRHEMLKDQIVIGMESRASELGYELCMHSLSRDPAEIPAVAAQLRKLNNAGVVFIPFIEPDYYGINNRILDICENFDLRYVVVDSPVASHGIIRGEFIGCDTYNTMRKLVHQLAERGFRKFAGLRVFNGVYSADQWLRGIIDQLAAEGLPIAPEALRTIDNVALPQQGREQLHAIFDCSDRPEVILCGHDALALNVLDELRRMKVEIPRDVALVGFDNDYYTEPLGLSSVAQPRREIGRRAIDLVLNRSAIRRQEFLPCEILLRESVTDYRFETHHSK